MPHFETPQPISVELNLRLANVRVTAGERADTIVRVRPRQSAKRDDVTAAERTRVAYADGRLLVKRSRRLREWNPFNVGGSIDVEIELPAGSQLSGRTVAGEFHCTGALGRCELKSGVGNITVERVAGDAELATGTGEVRAGEVDGSAVIRNSNGDTQVREVGGDLRVKAANGHIDIENSHGSLMPGQPTAGSASGQSTAARWSPRPQPGISMSGSPARPPPRSTFTRATAMSATTWTRRTSTGQLMAAGPKCGRPRAGATSRSAAGAPCPPTGSSTWPGAAYSAAPGSVGWSVG